MKAKQNAVDIKRGAMVTAGLLRLKYEVDIASAQTLQLMFLLTAALEENGVISPDFHLEKHGKDVTLDVLKKVSTANRALSNVEVVKGSETIVEKARWLNHRL